MQEITKDPNKQEVLTLMQSYAHAFKTEDKVLIQLITNQIYNYLSQVEISKVEAATAEVVPNG